MSEINQLKELLFGHEKQALDALTRRLETPESRSADVSDVLPEALQSSHARGPQLARALRAPVEQCVRDSVRDDPEEFAGVLYPVIGPAIRKSIAEAMRALARRINQSLESTLSPQRQLSWRFAAWRAGIPFGEFVLMQTLVYRVEEVFLIHRPSGLLIAHAHHDAAELHDSDAVSAMLTAIQDFVRDAFAVEGGEGIQTANVGDLVLWAINGPHAVLACVIRGVPPVPLRAEVQAVLERIHLRHGDALRRFTGETSDLEELEPELEGCLWTERRDTQPGLAPRRRPRLPLIVGVLAVIGLAYLLGVHALDAGRESRLRAALASTPGVVATEVERAGRVFSVRGLRDPLAPEIAVVAENAGVPVERVRGEFEPYQSLAPELVRVRAEAALAPPPEVSLSLEAGALIASGRAPAAWIDRAQRVAPAIAGVSRVDLSAVAPDDAALLADVRARIVPPESVTLSVEDGRLLASGTAAQDWIEAVPEALRSIAGLRGASLERLRPLEQSELETLARSLAERAIYFAAGRRFATGARAQLDRLASELARFGALAGTLGQTPRIVLTGHSDGTGTNDANRLTELGRAERVRDALVARGIDPAWLQLAGSGASGEARRTDPAARRVTVTANAVPSA